MSERNVRVARAIIEAWAAGGSARPWLDEDVEYVNPPRAIEPGTREGIEAFQRAIAGFREAWDADIVPLAFEDHGDDVLVQIALGVRGRASGVQGDTRQGWVWTIRDGRGVRFRWFESVEEARAALTDA